MEFNKEDYTEKIIETSKLSRILVSLPVFILLAAFDNYIYEWIWGVTPSRPGWIYDIAGLLGGVLVFFAARLLFIMIYCKKSIKNIKSILSIRGLVPMTVLQMRGLILFMILFCIGCLIFVFVLKSPAFLKYVTVFLFVAMTDLPVLVKLGKERTDSIVLGVASDDVLKVLEKNE